MKNSEMCAFIVPSKLPVISIICVNKLRKTNGKLQKKIEGKTNYERKIKNIMISYNNYL